MTADDGSRLIDRRGRCEAVTYMLSERGRIERICLRPWSPVRRADDADHNAEPHDKPSTHEPDRGART